MPARRRCAAVLTVLLTAAGCGGGTAATTTSPSTTTTTEAASTSAAGTTTSTTTPDTGPLAGLLQDAVADPLLGTGYHQMRYGDAARTFVESADAGVTNDGGRLVLAPFDPAPVVTGLGADQLLLEAWVAPHAGRPAPRAMVLYGRGVGGWNPYVAVDAASILAYLETTTDYQVRAPGGPADVRLSPTVFDWRGSAHFRADVAVFRYPDEADPVYEGEIECTFTGTLECVTLSDDGVLRPGDEGEAVQALQEALAQLGYLAAAPTGGYDEATEAAVRLFQRDYRLTVDGKAGPQTLGLVAEVAAGTSDIVLASRRGIGEVPFGTPADTARPALNALFGTPDATAGWYESECDGRMWSEVTWDGFTAVFTDRSGSRQFDGWQVDDLGDLPSWLYFAGGVRPSWRWSDFEDAGARFDRDPDDAVFWYHDDLGYGNGRFVDPPTGAPAAAARIRSFGTGTGGFVGC